MYISQLFLKNFRNYQEASLSFSPHLNIIYGANGQGKTNLLEALYFFVIGRSFRTHRNQDILRLDCMESFFKIYFIKYETEQMLSVFYNRHNKVIYHNDTKLQQLSSLFGIVQGVIFSPLDQIIITGGPAERRRYLDLQISKTDPEFLVHLSRYTEALQQRNILLRMQRIQNIDLWEDLMAKSAVYIISKRELLVDNLQKHIDHYQTQGLFSQDRISIKYRIKSQQISPKEVSYNDIRTIFEKFRTKELETGYTLFGPHRDDLEIFLDDRDTSVFGSEGQQRGCATLLRLAEWKETQIASGVSPIVFVDELGLSLDESRRHKLLQIFQSLESQIFITTPYQPNSTDFDSKLQSNVYAISAGCVTPKAIDL